MRRYRHTAVLIVVLAVSYFYAGVLGLSLATVHPSASAVWPPSGIALAAILLWGSSLWPGIFVGAFLVNVFVQGSVLTTLGIAVGNTLEAVIGAALVCRFAGGRKAFDQSKNILKFAVFAGILGPAVAATVGVISLAVGGFASWDQFWTIWLTWWLGDMVGILIVAPLLVLWMTQPLLPVKRLQVFEAAGLLLMLLFVGWLLFLNTVPAGLEYFALAPLLWGALRFGRRGAVTPAFIMSAIAVGGTAAGFGPFAGAHPHQSLLLLQVFMATLTLTALLVASFISERRRLEQRLRLKDAVSRILAESPAVMDAAPKIIQVMCETRDWQVGAIWNTKRSSNELTCVEFWSTPFVNVSQFEAVTRESKFSPGAGLPGRVWHSGKPEWITDITKITSVQRSFMATQEGLRAALGFPIKLGDEVVGVMECFSLEPREPDNDFLEIVGSIGAQLGQFMERKRAEEALRNSESRLRVALAAGQMGAWEWNTATNRVIWSSSLEAIHGLQPGTFGGTFDDFKRDIHRDDLQSVLAQIENILATRSDYHITYRIKRPDGAVRWVEAFGGVVLGTEGGPEKFAGVCMDITDRKEAEAALRRARDELARANQQLEKRVQQRTAELQLANAALSREREEEKRLEQQLRQSQKLESIGTLAGGIAHDFNNILNIIKGYASLLRQRGPGDDEVTESLEVIDETIERGASIVRQLLAMAKESAITFERVDLNDVVQQLKLLLGGTFPRTIDINLNLDSSLPPVLADANQMNQVLLNICVNARDAMPSGGELLLTTETVAGADLRAQFQDAKETPYACVTVKDTGFGMDPVVKSRIFEPFFTTKEQGQGTGLGLSVAYGIVTNHGGFIDVSSDPGHGTTFCLYLPVTEMQVAAVNLRPADGIQAPASAAATSHVVLFVEDEVRQLELMRRSLEKAGYRVLTAGDGVEAVELFLRHKNEISVVVLDLGLPKLNGWEVLRRMRQAEPTLKPILASGYISHEAESAMRDGELSGVVMKPYRPNEILEKISLAVMKTAKPFAVSAELATAKTEAR
jgi:two-component system, cell cycle sensor histidine kinase and response regulator CckA